MRHFIRLSALLLTVLSITSSPTMLHALSEDEVQFAEDLVTKVYIDHLPLDKATQLTPVGIARLVEMLGDPEFTPHHATIMLFLGATEDSAAYLALSDFASRSPQGPVTHAEYAAQVALRHAMGRLARSDDRALQFLTDEAEQEASAAHPSWSYRYLQGPRLQGVLERACHTGLALSGRREAASLLRQIHRRELANRASEAPGSEEKVRHLEESMRLQDEVELLISAPDRSEGRLP